LLNLFIRFMDNRGLNSIEPTVVKNN
jgi:hypothetical protein